MSREVQFWASVLSLVICIFLLGWEVGERVATRKAPAAVWTMTCDPKFDYDAIPAPGKHDECAYSRSTPSACLWDGESWRLPR